MRKLIRLSGLLSMIMGICALINPLPLEPDEIIAYMIARLIQIAFIVIGMYLFYWIPRKIKK